MQIPYIRYLEALVVGREKPVAIHDRLEELGLKFPLPGIQQVYNRFSTEQPEYFNDPTNSIETAWLQEWQLEKMFGYLYNLDVPSGVDGIEGEFKIMNDPLMYRLITSLALCNISEEDIELIVNGKYNMEYASEDVQEFLHYFFDVSDWTVGDKQEYVAQVEIPELKVFYKMALKGDKDYLLWKLGAAPDKSFDLMLRDMMTDSYYNFKERSKGDPDLAQRWGALAIKLTDRIDRLEKDTGDKKDFFAEFNVKLKSYREDNKNDDNNSPDIHISDLEND